MRTTLFDYHLPPERIAQVPAEPRDAARLLVLARDHLDLRHKTVRDLPELLAPGDLLVLNDTKVLPARLMGRKPTGGRVEVFLIEKVGDAAPGEDWNVLIGASHAPREGMPLWLPGGFEVDILEGPGEGGEALVRFRGPGPVRALAEEHGLPPLPPYIRREPMDPRWALDRERYQTIFARAEGALAAPTAGLHFTSETLNALRVKGVGVEWVTLHVGLGTFQPVRAEETQDIVLHEERYRVPGATSRAIAACRARGGRVVAVGTTVTRALESRPGAGARIPEPGEGTTHLFIGPGFEFQYVDGLLTNFHLPRSSLLMLVAAFAGRERILEAYRVAVDRGYRFYSYGDAMLIL